MKRAILILTTMGTAMGAAASGGAGPVLDSENGHYYEVGTTAAGDPAMVNFAQAIADAQSHSYDGMQGYLATITTMGERSFIAGLTSNVAWVGASDADQEGVWKWIGGPEAGQVFYTGHAWESNFCSGFCYWAPGEPNQAGEEDAMVVNWNQAGQWDDWNGANQANYIIEYSRDAAAVPEPRAWALLGLGFTLIGGVLRRRRRQPARPALNRGWA